MSQLGLGQLMQQGMVQGAGLYTQGQELGLARQRQAMQEQQLAQELADRRQRAEMLLRQEEANRALSRALLAPPTIGPDGQEVPLDQVIRPEDFADAHPEIQRMVSRPMQDRAEHAQAVARGQASYQAVKKAGLAKMLPPKLYDEWMNLGIQIDPADLPPEIAARQTDQQEGGRVAMINVMTISKPTDGVGPPAVDMAARQALESMPAEGVRIMYEQWKQNQEREYKARLLQQQVGQLESAYLAQGAAPTVAHGMAVAAVLNAPLMPNRGDSQQRFQMTEAIKDAERKYTLAKSAYEALNKTEVNGRPVSWGMSPPTPAEVERLNHPAVTQYGDGVADMSEGEYAALQQKVSAYRQMQEAERNLLDVGERAKSMMAQPSPAGVRPASSMGAPAPGFDQAETQPAAPAQPAPAPAQQGAPDPAQAAAMFQQFKQQNGRPPTREEFRAMMQGGAR